MLKFEEDYEIPQILGAIDGSHIRIIAPSENHEDYFNRKRYYSVNLQQLLIQVYGFYMFQLVILGAFTTVVCFN